MIVDLLLGIPLAVLNAVLSLIPAWNPLEFSPAWATDMAHRAKWMDGYVPVQLLGGTIVAWLGLRAAIGLMQAVSWLYEKIPAKFT